MSITSIRVAFTLASGNRKTGPIPVTVSARPSCPTACPLYGNGCYAEYGNTLHQWRAVTSATRGGAWEELCARVAKLPRQQLWRHNVSGDLPSEDRANINRAAVLMLVEAQRGKHGFTFTHYSPWEGENAAVIAEANRNGFTINLSADNLPEADAKAALGIAPVTVVLPTKTAKVQYTPAGRKVLQCPATYRDDVTCSTCGICASAKPERAIIGFPAHGTGKAKAQAIALQINKERRNDQTNGG
jgi:hypothetical protein